MDEAERQEIEALFGRVGKLEGVGESADPDMQVYVAQLVARRPAAAYALAKMCLAQEKALAAARDRIERLERGERSPAAANEPLRGGRLGMAMRTAVVGVAGSVAVGSTILEMLRPDSGDSFRSAHYDPDDIDALGFDDEPERR